MYKCIQKSSAIVAVAAVILVAVSIGCTAQTAKYEPTWQSLKQYTVPQWYEDAKLGIFIHWGVYSVPAWRKVTEGRYASSAEWYYARVMGELIEAGRLKKRTVGGAPAGRVRLILATMGDRVDEPILELTEQRLLLLDGDGRTKYDWRRVGRLPK